MAERGEDDDDQKRLLLQNSFLPFDLLWLIIARLPSRQLFDLRLLCKAVHRHALLALARRPFFVFQQAPPSPLCLLPLDPPCSPLPSSFSLAKPSFRLFSSSANLLCLHRKYALLLDICVCDIFRKWKIVLPPIVHPSNAPHIIRRVFLEDVNVESLQVVGFHAAQPTINTEEEGVFSPGDYRIFVASGAYLRVFDSHVDQWSSPVHFPSHLSTRRAKPPSGFATSDGNLILTFTYELSQMLFNYKDQSFHAQELASAKPEFEVAEYPASAALDPLFMLRVRLPHVKECIRSSPGRGLVLEGLCSRDSNVPYRGSYSVSMDGVRHKHTYVRKLLGSTFYAHQSKVYALVMERDELRCYTQQPRNCNENYELLESAWDLQPSVSNECHSMRPTKFEGKQWHDLHSLDVGKCLRPEEGATFDCVDFFPARSPHKLTLYIAHIDTKDWTMKVTMGADASACLGVSHIKGAFSLKCVRAQETVPLYEPDQV